MKKLIYLSIILFPLFSIGQKNTLDLYLKKQFPNASIFRNSFLGEYCGKKVYFCEGYCTDDELKNRAIVYKSKNKYLATNSFFYWCSNLVMISYTHKSQKQESDYDLENLSIKYENGKFKIIDVSLKKTQNEAMKNNEHIEPMGSQYILFREYISEIGCNKF